MQAGDGSGSRDTWPGRIEFVAAGERGTIRRHQPVSNAAAAAGGRCGSSISAVRGRRL